MTPNLRLHAAWAAIALLAFGAGLAVRNLASAPAAAAPTGHAPASSRAAAGPATTRSATRAARSLHAAHADALPQSAGGPLSVAEAGALRAQLEAAESTADEFSRLLEETQSELAALRAATKLTERDAAETGAEAPTDHPFAAAGTAPPPSWAERRAFFAKMDTAGLTPAELAAHSAWLATLAAIEEADAQRAASTDARERLELRNAANQAGIQARAGLDSERQLLLRQIGRSLGYDESGLQRFVDYVEYGYRATTPPYTPPLQGRCPLPHVGDDDGAAP